MKPILVGKAILIVDDYPAMRKAIRNMLYSLDANNIAEADNGVNALAAMGRTQFDIVLCDYNLGAGKNGQQVLEEARLQKLISPGCVFVIISGEQSTSMVLGAMDSKPDEYLAKPFNAQQLFVRLERNLNRKALLQNIEKEIERGNLAQAIQQCDKLLAEDHKKIRTHLLKIRAELATLVGDYEGGKRIYCDILHERDLPWARLGLGIIEFQQGDFAQAGQHFDDLLKAHPMFLEGYDWLYKVYEAEDKLKEAQDVVNQAVDLSPQSILRQKKLAETADKIGNIELAEKAYKAAVSLGKHSIYKSSSDFTNLAKLYSKTSSPEKALETLSNMRHEFQNDPEAELRAITMETELHSNAGNDELANVCLQQALDLNKKLAGKTPRDLLLDIAKNCFQQKQQSVAELIMNDLIKTHIDDDQFLDDVRRMQSGIGMDNHSEDLIKRTKRALVATNNQGVTLYKQGKFTEAMALFEKAIASMPENQTIIINTLKIILHDLKAAGMDDEKLVRAQSLLKKARHIGVDRHKLGVLQMEFSNLLRQYNEAKS